LLEQSQMDKPNPKDMARKKVSIGNWYTNTMKPVDASAPAPANRLLTRKMVCMKGGGFNGGNAGGFNQPEPAALANAFQITDMPADYQGEIIKGAVLITTVHHFRNYIFGNIGHWSSGAYAIYDALDALKDHHKGTLPVNVTAVLMHQAESDQVGPSDWHKRVAQLAAHGQGLSTRYLKKPDLRKGICAEQVVIYDRPEIKERHFFTSPAHAAAFQEHAIDTFGLPTELKATVRKPSRIVNMVIRRDDQGYGNWKDINEKTKAYLATRCWSMIEYIPGQVQPMTLKQQVEAFAKGDISVSVHGAHFQNLVWQGLKTAALIVEKRGWHDTDVSQLGNEMGIFTYKVGPTSFPNKPKLAALKEHDQEVEIDANTDLDLQQSGGLQQDPILNAPMRLNFEKELKPVLEQAINDLEKIAVRGPPCHPQ